MGEKKYYWVHLLYCIEYDEQGNTLTTEMVRGYVTNPTERKETKPKKEKKQFFSEMDSEVLLWNGIMMLYLGFITIIILGY